MRARFAVSIFAGLLIGLAMSQLSAPNRLQSQEQSARENEELTASAAAFEKAFNAGDARTIGAQFAENAEAIDEEGNILEGREAIAARFAELFKEFPKARIQIELTSLRKLGPDVAVEDGYSTMTRTPEEPGGRSPYTAVHVRRDGKWLIASVRDFPEEGSLETAHEQLIALEWLVGKWVDESAEGRVETHCRWSDDGNYLLQDYKVKARGAVMQGTQRIAWDPLRRTIRSWAFDETGAFTEATWTPLHDGWSVKATGVTPDGRGVSVSRLLTSAGTDAFSINSTALVIGNELMPDSSVRVVRQPPAPQQ